MNIGIFRKGLGHIAFLMISFNLLITSASKERSKKNTHLESLNEQKLGDACQNPSPATSGAKTIFFVHVSCKEQV